MYVLCIFPEIHKNPQSIDQRDKIRNICISLKKFQAEF